MAAQRFLNNFDWAFLGPVTAATHVGFESTIGRGILQISDAASALLLNPTGGDWYVLTAYKRSGSVESAIEIIKVLGVNEVAYAAPGECRIRVERGHEGSSLQTYVAGDLISMRITAGGLNDLASDAEVAAALALKIDADTKDASGGVPGLTLFKLNLRNAANTITSWFTTAATAARTWTMPDKDGVVAMISDITGTNSGTNTGDNAVNSSSTPAAHAGAGGAAHANAVAAGAAGFMTGADKTKLDGVAASANNYTHPANHAPSIITQDASNRFVTDAEKTTWNAKAAANANTTGSSGSVQTTNWKIWESGGYLYCEYGGVKKARLDSSGNIVVIGNVSAYGAI